MFDDFENKRKQTSNDKLILIREEFDKHNLISALHSLLSDRDKNFLNLLPPLVNLKKKDKESLIEKLHKLNFFSKKGKAA